MSRGKQQRRVSLVLTDRSLADLRAIESYSIREWGRKMARKYIDGIAGALDRLQENPNLLRLEPEIAPNLFFYRFKKHVLVCDVTPIALTVLTIVHTSMDLPARLLELEPRLAAEADILQNKMRTD